MSCEMDKSPKRATNQSCKCYSAEKTADMCDDFLSDDTDFVLPLTFSMSLRVAE